MLSSEIDTEEESAEIQSSDTLTTGRMPVVINRTDPLTTGRMPVVIPGAKKKLPRKVDKSPIKTKHRVLLHAAVVLRLGVFIFTTLISFLPLGENGQALGIEGFFRNIGLINLVNSNSRNSALVADIMRNDGYDPGSQASQQYNASLGITGTEDHFPYGQCTYWASYRYHQLTGFWVPWSGNAYQWAYNAPAYGWIVSSTPRVGAIAVFQPGVQYASSLYGHVGIVESINADGSFVTSNMNVYGHSFGSVADLTNYTGYGVSFVYHP
jgi:surface antigen